MVQVGDNFIRGCFQFHKVDQQSDIIQLTATRVDLDLVVVAMQILTLPFVTAQLMRAREVSLNHYFELSRHNQPEDKILARSSIREVTRHGGKLWRNVRP